MLVGYAPIYIDEQELSLQHDALLQAGAKEVAR